MEQQSVTYEIMKYKELLDEGIITEEDLNIKPYGLGARHVLVRAIGASARTKDEPSDLINVAIEELIRQHYELPDFSTLVRA